MNPRADGVEVAIVSLDGGGQTAAVFGIGTLTWPDVVDNVFSQELRL